MKSEYFSPGTYEALYPVMQYENVLALRIALETGMRIDDVLRLKWDDFYAPQKFMFFAKKTGKKGKKRISKDLYSRLTQKRAKNQKFVFPGRKPGKHRTRQAVWRDVKKAAEAASINGQLSPHSARKTYAVELRKEKGLPAVQKELQHSNRETTMLYAFADVAGRCGADGSPELSERIARRVVELLMPFLEEIKKNRP